MLLRIPKIAWGTGFANTLNLEVFDEAVAWSEPWEDSEFGRSDAWVTGSDQLLKGIIRSIPTNTGENPDPLATGWDGATGVRAFLEWARQMNEFRWFPDRSSGTYQPCRLVEPMRGTPPLEPDGSRQLAITIRSTDGSAFTGY